MHFLLFALSSCMWWWVFLGGVEAWCCTFYLPTWTARRKGQGQGLTPALWCGLAGWQLATFPPPPAQGRKGVGSGGGGGPGIDSSRFSFFFLPHPCHSVCLSYSLPLLVAPPLDLGSLVFLLMPALLLSLLSLCLSFCCFILFISNFSSFPFGFFLQFLSHLLVGMVRMHKASPTFSLSAAVRQEKRRQTSLFLLSPSHHSLDGGSHPSGLLTHLTIPHVCLGLCPIKTPLLPRFSWNPQLTNTFPLPPSLLVLLFALTMPL